MEDTQRDAGPEGNQRNSMPLENAIYKLGLALSSPPPHPNPAPCHRCQLQAAPDTRGEVRAVNRSSHPLQKPTSSNVTDPYHNCHRRGRPRTVCRGFIKTLTGWTCIVIINSANTCHVFPVAGHCREYSSEQDRQKPSSSWRVGTLILFGWYSGHIKLWF